MFYVVANAVTSGEKSDIIKIKNIQVFSQKSSTNYSVDDFSKSTDLSPVYADHFETVLTISPQNQLCLWRSLNYTQFMHQFHTIRVIHQIG